MAPNHPVARARQAHGAVKEFLPVLTAMVTIAGAGLAAWEASQAKQPDATHDELLVDEHNKPLRVRYVLHHEPFLSFLGGTATTLLKFLLAVLVTLGLTWFLVWFAFQIDQPLWCLVGYGFVAVVAASLTHQRHYAQVWQKRMTKHG